ncbi:ATP-binding protein [Vibrio parahaemolyticus]|uniref:ATP-binding protein n=1 Tax=Vibrio parahaemolyticus TaxID=670 RepID=UPI00111D2FF8|nr:ATP-binding protein [Vibrio parahaemolyticus]EGQ8508701.1 ATP-binding protein [Vibrio parahaemolyticus]EGQ9819145.1 ATP-binding protein [Vibrio parahaemolyticus]EJE8521428.1 ATP-binding protein [Vibrio parahaemolyticus]EJL6383530.1 ATP-binding protein [Vibrio parahaemolyticus]ELA7007290.1 ATP-binding protein [Vibrio parahaemolyticus]
MIINKNWDLDIAFEVINDRYYPGGLQSGPQRNRQIETWCQLVGKTRALEQLDSLIASCGSINKMSQSVRMSSGSIKKLRTFFESLPDELEIVEDNVQHRFIEGEVCSLEEDLTHEFKEVKGSNPAKSIQNLVDEYVVAFLNGSGGSIFWGICDDGKVKSLHLSTAQKDEINKVVNAKIGTIQPAIDPTKITVRFHSVINTENGYVFEVNVPKSNTIGLFFNSSGDTWVRVNGCKQKLKGLALQDYILERMQKNN